MFEPWFQMILASSAAVAAASLGIIAFTGRTIMVTVMHVYKQEADDTADWWKDGKGNDEMEGN